MAKKTKSQLAKQRELQKKHDATATREDLINDIVKLQEENPLVNISRDFYRLNGKYSERTVARIFGTFPEFRKAAELEDSRHERKIKNDIARNASLEPFRKFCQEELLPYHNKYVLEQKNKEGIVGVVIGSDFHDIHVDPFALYIFLDTCRIQQPPHIVLNGDIFDNYEFSSYDIDPRQMKMKERFDFVKNRIFKPLRELCPNSQIDLVIGNHEWRILKMLATKSPFMKVLMADVLGLSLSDIFGLDEFKINLITKLDLAAFMEQDVKRELRENYLKLYDCFIVAHEKDYGFGMSGTSGHVHRPEFKTDVTEAMGHISWSTTGCLKNVRAEYVPGPNKWTNGFGLAYIDVASKTVIQQPITMQKDWAIVAGKVYRRSSDKNYMEEVERMFK